jgi:hypothetical protein
VCIIAFLAAVLFLWPHGLWLLVAVVPLGLAWLCYLGAVSAARQYGSALRMLLELNRFTLYEQAHLPLPSTLVAEQATVANLSVLSISPDPAAPIRYRHPPPPPDVITVPGGPAS